VLEKSASCRSAIVEGNISLQRLIDTAAVGPTADRVGQRAWLGSICFQRGFYLQNETFTIKET
jgi:hypothetical protein